MKKANTQLIFRTLGLVYFYVHYLWIMKLMSVVPMLKLVMMSISEFGKNNWQKDLMTKKDTNSIDLPLEKRVNIQPIITALSLLLNKSLSNHQIDESWNSVCFNMLQIPVIEKNNCQKRNFESIQGYTLFQ